jgi:hypothetical protein
VRLRRDLFGGCASPIHPLKAKKALFLAENAKIAKKTKDLSLSLRPLRALREEPLIHTRTRFPWDTPTCDRCRSSGPGRRLASRVDPHIIRRRRRQMSHWAAFRVGVGRQGDGVYRFEHGRIAHSDTPHAGGAPRRAERTMEVAMTPFVPALADELILRFLAGGIAAEVELCRGMVRAVLTGQMDAQLAFHDMSNRYRGVAIRVCRPDDDSVFLNGRAMRAAA